MEAWVLSIGSDSLRNGTCLGAFNHLQDLASPSLGMPGTDDGDRAGMHVTFSPSL